MASPACCAAGKPLVHEYIRKGEVVMVGDMECYVVGSGKAAIIVMTDIFGHEFNQVFQVCDRLSEAGYVVASPELFGHKSWPMSKFPPPDKGEFMAFINGPGNTEKVTGQVKATMEWLKSNKGVSEFALQGHCWSSTISLINAGSGDFKAVSCNHPAFFCNEKETAEAAKCPVAIIPAGGDPGDDAFAALKAGPFADKCVLQRFEEMEHGFLAARGNWQNPKVSEQATKALNILIDFYKAAMPPQA